jgi:ABC-type nitrate/sulfonate/bicarbonate transport system ATPase subunit
MNKVDIGYAAGDPVLKNVHESIAHDDRIALLGANGNGKSTLMKGVLNLICPEDPSTISINGKPASQFEFPISYTPQANELLPWLSVRENIGLWSKDSNNDNLNIVNEVIELLDLKEAQDKLPQELSGGMARRTALARCLATKSSIMCLDEVLVGIQRSFRRDLMLNLRTFLKKNSITTIIISHDYEEAVFMSDRIIVLAPSPTLISKPPIKVVEILGENRNMSIFNKPEFELVAKQLIS